MQHAWWLPVRELARHTLVYSALLIVLVAAMVYGSVLISVAKRLLDSKFSLHVLMFLEYAGITLDAIVIMIFMTGDILRIVKRQES
jgi:hypothetical protein